MKQLLVVSNDTYANGLTAGTTMLSGISDLAMGAFCLFDKDPDSANYDKSVDLAAASAVTTLPKVFVIANKGNNGIKITSPIVAANARATNVVATAGTAKVVTVGNQSSGGTTYSYNLPTLEAGQIFGITVINPDKPVGSIGFQKDYTIDVSSTDTMATLQAALIAKVNVDTNKIVTAAIGYSLATDGMMFTGAPGKNFMIAPIGILRNANIVETTTGTAVALVQSQGSLIAMQDLEKFDWVERGRLSSRPPDELSAFTSDLVAGKIYDQCIITSVSPNKRPFTGGIDEPQEIVIAVQSDLTTSATTGKSKRGILAIVTSI